MSPKRIKICLWKYPVLIKFTGYRSATWLKLNFFTGTFQRFWPYNLCVKSVQIWSFFWSVFSAFGLNADIYSVNCRIQPECGKIRTRKNTVFGHFSQSELSWDYVVQLFWRILIFAEYLLQWLLLLIHENPMINTPIFLLLKLLHASASLAK